MIIYTLVMIFSLITMMVMSVLVSKNNPQTQIQQVFLVNIILIVEICFSVIFQIILNHWLHIEPTFFDSFTYIGTSFIPVSLLLTSLIFSYKKLNLTHDYMYLLIIPLVSLLLLWTNDIHHLFFEVHSINYNEIKLGVFGYINSIYSYTLFTLSVFLFIRAAIKNAGLFSTQFLLILIGTLMPVITNILGALNILSTTIYTRPLSFIMSATFFSLAIFKYGILKLRPIALQKIVNKMSDGYVILNDANVITDYNQTFIQMFQIKNKVIKNIPIEKILSIYSATKNSKTKLLRKIEQTRLTDAPYNVNIYIRDIEKYFNIDISNIKDKNAVLGTIILFKDITQHKQDLHIIQNNQDILIEQERLASLGQMIGGIAHNLKTPIMSIGGATKALTDLTQEYELSIKDREVTPADHEQIANEMKEWTDKIKTHIEYMSDIITTVKDQAVTLTQKEEIAYTPEELIKRIDVLMKHEIKHALINFNIVNNIHTKLLLKGDINGLVQVLNNIISNGIQAYNGKPNQNIDLILSIIDNNLVITIRDYASGMSKEVQSKLFHSMITTKGKNGTGLGMYLSYSNIKAHFHGEITFESSSKGTTFYVSIPLK